MHVKALHYSIHWHHVFLWRPKFRDHKETCRNLGVCYSSWFVPSLQPESDRSRLKSKSSAVILLNFLMPPFFFFFKWIHLQVCVLLIVKDRKDKSILEVKGSISASPQSIQFSTKQGDVFFKRTYCKLIKCQNHRSQQNKFLCITITLVYAAIHHYTITVYTIYTIYIVYIY